MTPWSKFESRRRQGQPNAGRRIRDVARVPYHEFSVSAFAAYQQHS